MVYWLDLIVRLVVVTITLSFFVHLRLRARRSRLLRHFLLFILMLLVWTVYPLLYRSLLRDLWPGLTMYLGHFYWLVICFTGYIWLLFCLSYINHGLPLPRWRYLWLAVPPAFFFLSYLTNLSHLLFFTGFGVGILYWLHTATNYAYVLVGNVMLLGYFHRQYRAGKIRTVLLVIAASVPLLASMAQHYLIFITPDPITLIVDPLPAAFCVTMGIFIFIAYKHHFLDILPAAFANIAALTKEALLVLDYQGLVVYANPAFEKAFAYLPKTGDGLDEVLAHLGELIAPESKDELALRRAAPPAWEGETELAVDNNGQRSCYLLNADRVRDNRGRPLGRVWSFSNITGYKRHNEELRRINDCLAAANAGLTRLAAVTEELAAAKERERMAREIHDTLGHAMTVLIAMLETGLAGMEPAAGEEAVRTQRMIEVARRGMTELRRVVASSAAGAAPNGRRDLLTALRSLVEAFQATGIKVDLTLDGLDEYDGHSCAEAVYRICQEALTNALRHGMAQNVAILLRYSVDSLVLNVIDDGRGCPEIKPSFGLAGMEQRAAAAGGKVVYGSLEPNGFRVSAVLPLKDVKRDD